MDDFLRLDHDILALSIIDHIISSIAFCEAFSNQILTNEANDSI